jgi:hypothetical protein
MQRPNRRSRALIASLATLMLVATVAVFSTIGSASPNAAQQQYGPTNTAPPVLTGEARATKQLTTSNGAWQSSTAITYTYGWQRCEAAGTGCADIAGATANRYTAQTADVGKRLRSKVTARNTTGSSVAFSALTEVVVAQNAEGQIRLANGLISVPAAAVTAPERLIVSDIQFSQMPIRSRNPLQARFRIKDTRGFVVRDALVYANAIPFGRITQPGEVKTDQEGWATMTITPTRLLPLANGYLLTMFVRARKSGDNILAGVSTRRLISVRTARPAR